MTAADPAPRCDTCDRSDCERLQAQISYHRGFGPDGALDGERYKALVMACTNRRQAWPARARAAEAMLRDVVGYAESNTPPIRKTVDRIRDHLEKLP